MISKGCIWPRGLDFDTCGLYSVYTECFSVQIWWKPAVVDGKAWSFSVETAQSKEAVNEESIVFTLI